MSAHSICLVQFDISWEDPTANHSEIESLLPREEPFDLLLLPEMFNTGFTMQAARNAQPMSGASATWMKQLSLNHHCDVMGSLIIEEGGLFYNRLLHVKAGEICATYDKRHLFAYAGEHKAFTAGDDQLYCQINDLNIMPLICYDLRFPVWSRNTGSVDVLVYVANWPAKRRVAWRQLLIARAIENQCYAIGLNRVGTDGNEHVYQGDSLVVDPYGKVLHDLGEEETSLVVTLEKSAVEQCRTHLPFLNDRDQFTLL